MRKCVFLLLMFLLVLHMAGCTAGNSEMDRAMTLRQTLLSGDGCTFDSIITADYGDKIYTFSLQCKADSSGTLSFTVTDPETISGITGNISSEKGLLTFDDHALAFEMLADGYVTPVTTPWLFVKTLKSGYLRACDKEEDLLRIIIDDSYEDESLQMDIWVNGDNVPVAADLLWQGRRVLKMELINFQFM